MRATVLKVVGWIAGVLRALRDLPRAVARWLRSHAASCVALVWLSGMSVFGVATVRRVVAAQVADVPTSTHKRSDGPTEAVAMLDVDEINGIRVRRLHALGLAAAGDTDAPDERTIQDARAAQARGIVLDGQQVATAGNVIVVTRGGIAEWLKRNRGKKADPETLAWLRGQEAAEGRAAYAGWADRDDANILNWVREQRRSGAAPPAGPMPSGAAEAAALREAGVPEAAAQTQPGPAAGSADTRAGDTHAEGSGDHPAEGADATGSGGTRLASSADARVDGGNAKEAARTRTEGTHAHAEGPSGTGAEAAHAEGPGGAGAEAAHAEGPSGAGAKAAHAEDPGGAGAEAAHAEAPGGGPPADARDHERAGARSPAVQGVYLIALGSAAAAALRPQRAVDPSAGEIASLRERLEPLISTGAGTISIRDHRIVLMLVCDQLFRQNQPELTREGTRVVRELGRLLAGDRGGAYKIVVDRERAFELVSNLAIAGLAPERIEIALKDVDRAIDIVELEWIAVKELP
jgi:hypothetical protein